MSNTTIEAWEYFSKPDNTKDLSIECVDSITLHVNRLYLSSNSEVIKEAIVNDPEVQTLTINYQPNVLVAWLSYFHPICYKVNPVDIDDIKDIDKAAFLELCCKYDTMKHFKTMEKYIVSLKTYSADFIKAIFKIQSPAYETLQTGVFANIVKNKQHELSSHIPPKFIYDQYLNALGDMKQHAQPPLRWSLPPFSGRRVDNGCAFTDDIAVRSFANPTRFTQEPELIGTSQLVLNPDVRRSWTCPQGPSSDFDNYSNLDNLTISYNNNYGSG